MLTRITVLRDTRAKDTQLELSVPQCIICLHKFPNIVILPCKHQFTCTDCFPDFSKKRQQLCPNCMASYTDNIQNLSSVVVPNAKAVHAF